MHARKKKPVEKEKGGHHQKGIERVALVGSEGELVQCEKAFLAEAHSLTG